MISEVVIRRPKYDETEIQAFVKVAAKGEEVEAQDIGRGAGRAAALLWIADNSGPVAVAALKTPFESYKIRVFSKAGVSARHQEFALELGYVYVEKTHRKQGLGEKLVQAAIALEGHQNIYATTRIDNQSMQRILQRNRFLAIGSTYLSERNGSRLLLFGRHTKF
jgi:predicted GNAT family N-acyltransferase